MFEQFLKIPMLHSLHRTIVSTGTAWQGPTVSSGEITFSGFHTKGQYPLSQSIQKWFGILKDNKLLKDILYFWKHSTFCMDMVLVDVKREH